MKEHPILFSTEMVKAILEDRKSQTRRVVKLPKWMIEYSPDLTNAYADGGVFAPGAYLKVPLTSGGMKETVQRVFCPYGYPSSPSFLIERGHKRITRGLSELDMQPMKPEDADRLWVRETWLKSELGKIYYKQQYIEDRIYGRADEWNDEEVKWRPSIFMPRWASRITLEITNIRVQRVQEISLADVDAEGIPNNPMGLMSYRNDGFQRRQDYEWLWEEINGKKYPWSSNPWVWVIEFQRIEGKE